jgi:hypothetical protein
VDLAISSFLLNLKCSIWDFVFGLLLILELDGLDGEWKSRELILDGE